jgi:hypothetical protein
MTVANPWEVVAETGGGDYEVVKAGAYPAVLVALVDLGTHEEEFEEKDGKNKGQKKIKNMRKVLLVWELTGEPAAKPGTNQVIGKDFNLVFTDRAKLRIFCETWRGVKYKEGEKTDLTVLIGKPCMITTTAGVSKASGKEYAKVEAVSPAPRGMTVPPPKYTPAAYRLGTDLPDWIPFIYGTDPTDFILLCQELKPGTPANAAYKAAQATPNGVAPPVDHAPKDEQGKPAF